MHDRGANNPKPFLRLRCAGGRPAVYVQRDYFATLSMIDSTLIALPSFLPIYHIPPSPKFRLTGPVCLTFVATVVHSKGDLATLRV